MQSRILVLLLHNIYCYHRYYFNKKHKTLCCFFIAIVFGFL